MKLTKHGLLYGDTERIAIQCAVSVATVKRVLYGTRRNKRVAAKIEAFRKEYKQGKVA